MPIITGRELKTQGLSLLIQGITGSSPIINRYDDYNELVLTENQIKAGQDYFQELMDREPGEIRVEGMGRVFTPYFTRKYIWWLVGIPAGMLLLGGLLKKR